MQEGLEALHPVAIPGVPELPGETRRRHRQPQVEPAPQIEPCPGQQQAAQGQALQGENDHPVGIAEQDRRGLDPDFQVIVTVGHGVVSVVAHGPQQVGDVQQPRGGRQFAVLRGEGHQDAPGIRRPQYHLRVIGVALHEGVAGGQGQGAERQPDRGGVGAQHQQEGGAHQHREQYQGLLGADFAGGQGPLVGALDLAVHLAVGEVVDGAAAGAGQHHPEGEDQHMAQGRLALGGDPQRHQGWP